MSVSELSSDKLGKLYFEEDMTPSQIARIYGIPVSRIYTLLHRYGFSKCLNTHCKLYVSQHLSTETQAKRVIFRKSCVIR